MLRRFVLWLIVAVAAIGCYPVEGPELVELTEITPPAVSRGDRAALVGSGFPEGKPAEVVLRGTLYRPGAEPEDVRQRIAGRAASAERIEWLVTPELLAGLAGERQGHATFRGDVRVWFEAVSPTAPKVTGALRSVTFDIYQPASTADRALDEQATVRVLSYLGIEHTTEAAPGLTLGALTPDSPLLEAGLLSGDVLVEASGVRLYAPADLRPRRSARTLALRFYRPPSRELFEVRVDLSALQPPSPTELAPVAASAALAIALLLVLAGPFGRTLLGIERFVRQTSERARGAPRLRAVFGSWIPLAFENRTALSINFGAFLGIGALVTAFSFGIPRLVGRFDLVALFGLSAGTLICAKVARGGIRGDRWSLRAGIYSGVCGLIQVVATALALLGVGLVHSSLSASQVVAAQGPWPWQFGAFGNPGLFLLGCVTFLSAIPDAARSSQSLVELSALKHRPPGAFRTLELLATVGDRIYLFATAAFLAIAFLGGWRLPPLDVRPLTAQVLGAAVFELKFALSAAAILAAREYTARTPVDLVAGIAVKRVLPVAAIGCAGALAFANWQQGEQGAWASDLVGPILATWAAGFAITALVQLRRTLAESTAGHTVNPWI